MNKLKGLAVVVLAGFTMGANAQSVVQVGISAEPYPPFTYKAPDGKWTGFEVDMQKAICKSAGLTCKTVPTAWSGIIPALQIKKIDAIMNSMTITPEREKEISFTHPYYETGLEFVALASSKLDFPKGMKGKIIGIQGATQAADFARAKLAPEGARIKTYDQQDQLSRDLLAGRVDGMVTDSVYAKDFVKDNKGLVDVEVTDWPTQQIGIGIRKNDTQLQAELNKGIAAVNADGTCEKLSTQYLGFNVCPKS